MVRWLQLACFDLPSLLALIVFLAPSLLNGRYISTFPLHTLPKHQQALHLWEHTLAGRSSWSENASSFSRKFIAFSGRLRTHRNTRDTIEENFTEKGLRYVQSASRLDRYGLLPDCSPCFPGLRVDVSKSVNFANIEKPNRGVVEKTLDSCPDHADTCKVENSFSWGIALSSGHDASVALSKDGKVQCVLELERWFGIRYYRPPAAFDEFREAWLEALRVVRDRCECDEGGCPSSFDYGVITGGLVPGLERLALIVEEVFEVKAWRSVDHHEAHAHLGFRGSAFRSSIVVSYDAGGNDGCFNVYFANGSEMRLFARLDYYFGSVYNYLASFVPEVSGTSNELPCSGVSLIRQLRYTGGHMLDYAGKLMAYAATSNSSVDSLINEWVRANFLYKSIPPHEVRDACRSLQGQRAIAAAAQQEFENTVRSIIVDVLKEIPADQTMDGIVLTGGCALNVLTNQMVQDELTLAGESDSIKSSGSTIQDVFVPPASNDAGLSVGALWAVIPPRTPQALQYLGFRVWDLDSLDQRATERGALRLSALGGPEYLADLLSGGSAWKKASRNRKTKPIIAVVRGRQEFGPRALGHRSLLAVPDSDTIRERMNTLKYRQWYRPICPILADEALEQVFGRTVKSRYMTMAPRVRDEIRKRFPAMVHLDGTARHQSVGYEDEPWLHALLLAVGKRTGLAALINTSFNTRGKPIVNTTGESLKMLDELEDLDYVLIEDWLFPKSSLAQLEHQLRVDRELALRRALSK